MTTEQLQFFEQFPYLKPWLRTILLPWINANPGDTRALDDLDRVIAERKKKVVVE
jgi:hypothetical protein